MASFHRILASVPSYPSSALLFCCGLAMACGALPVRVQSLSSPSRDPELTPTQPESFSEYASGRLARRDARANIPQDAEREEPDDDPFTIYQHGGRDILRHALRRLREHAASDMNVSFRAAPWLRNMNLQRCLDSTLSEMFNLVFPHHELSLLLGSLGWQGLSPRDPIPMDPVLAGESMIDDLHRLLLFEAGVKVEGRWIEDSQAKVLEIVYKVVHERGEPETWQLDDLNSTKVTWVWTQNSPQQWRVQWRVAVAQGLYESFPEQPKRAQIKGFQVDLNWIQQGSHRAFEGRLAHHAEALNFGWQEDTAKQSLQLFWSTNHQFPPETLRLQQIDSRLCVQTEQGP